MFTIGCILIFGQYGPYMLSWGVYRSMFTLWYGAGTFTTLLLAVYLKEEVSPIADTGNGRQLPRRSIWKTNQIAIAMASVACCFQDMAPPLSGLLSSWNVSFGTWHEQIYIPATFFFLVIFPIQIFAVRYFVKTVGPLCVENQSLSSWAIRCVNHGITCNVCAGLQRALLYFVLFKYKWSS